MRDAAEDERLAAARAGDEVQFRELVGPYRRELEAHCYRMMGSLADAEDLVQETLLRAWRGLPRFEGRSSLRSWLYKIATNATLDALARRPRRTLPTEIGEPADPALLLEPAPDPRWLEPAPDALWHTPAPGPEARFSARESVTLAFMVALHELPATQRAVLVLRDVMGWSAAETAELLDTTVAAANSLLQRARATLKQRSPDLDADAPRPPADSGSAALLASYVRAWEGNDVPALVALLQEDALLAMPPQPQWFRGREAIGAFLGVLLPQLGRVEMVPISASGVPSFAVYVEAPGAGGVRRAAAIHVPRFAGDSLVELHAFLMPALFPRFGLPIER